MALHRGSSEDDATMPATPDVQLSSVAGKVNRRRRMDVAAGTD